MTKKHDTEIVKTIKMTLPVELTDAEVLEYGSKAARISYQIDEEEIAEKGRRLQIKESIDGLRATHRDLSARVRTREELRDVVCEVVNDYTLGEQCTVRVDTYAIVSRRPLASEERQAPLLS